MHPPHSATGWRPVGYWGLTLSTVLGFPVLLLAPIVFPGADLQAASQALPYVLVAWCGAAGIRQWGKNMGSEYGRFSSTTTTSEYGGDSWSA